MSESTQTLDVTPSPSNSSSSSPHSIASLSPMFTCAEKPQTSDELSSSLSHLNISNGKPITLSPTVASQRSPSIQSTASYSPSVSRSDSEASIPSPTTLSPNLKAKKLKPRKPSKSQGLEKKMQQKLSTVAFFYSPESENLRRKLQTIASGRQFSGPSPTATPQIMFPTPAATIPVTPPIDPQPLQPVSVSVPMASVQGHWGLFNGQLVYLPPQYVEWEHHQQQQHAPPTESTSPPVSQSSMPSSMTAVYTTLPSPSSGAYPYSVPYPTSSLPAQSSSPLPLPAEDQKEKAAIASPPPTALVQTKFPAYPHTQERGTGVAPSTTTAPTTSNSPQITSPQSVTSSFEPPFLPQMVHPAWYNPYGLVSTEQFFPTTQLVEYPSSPSSFHSPNHPRRVRRPGVCLFIFHLPADTNDEELFQLFRPYGMVLSAKVIRDKATYDSKGYGFVNMATSQDADNAIDKLNGFRYKTKYLKVSYKKKKSHGRNTK